MSNKRNEPKIVDKGNLESVRIDGHQESRQNNRRKVEHDLIVQILEDIYFSKSWRKVEYWCRAYGVIKDVK